MKLTTEDKTRIEQEARKIAAYVLSFKPEDVLPDDSVLFGATHGAEYATIYERQEQQELRNKVIQECIEQLKDTREGDMIVRLLNSLKTKS